MKMQDSVLGSCFFYSSIYGFFTGTQKKMTNIMIKDLAPLREELWLVFGDFNQIMSP